MAPFFSETATKRLTPPADLGFEPSDWVEIRTKQTSGMRRRVMQRAMVMRIGGEDLPTLDLFSYRGALLEEIIVGWSSPRPVSQEAIDDLDPAVMDWIASEFDALNKGRTDAEKNAFASDSPSGPPPASPPPSPMNSDTSPNAELSPALA